MIKQILTILIISVMFIACNRSNQIESEPHRNSVNICTDQACEGSYTGPEFSNGSDVAHQFSNEMSDKVGDKLKELFKEGKYSKVEFSKIRMSTEGMGSGQVTYVLSIPFIAVKEKCQAYTSFDHVGGWNHPPALSERKTQLGNALLEGEKLDISSLKTTPEGLQEYWIQWKNKEIQSDCISKVLNEPIDINIVSGFEYTSGGVPKGISSKFCDDVQAGFYGRYNIVDMSSLNTSLSHPISATIDIYRSGSMASWKLEDLDQKICRIWTKSNLIVVWDKLQVGENISVVEEFVKENNLFHYLKGTVFYFETANYSAQFRIDNKIIKEITIARQCQDE